MFEQLKNQLLVNSKQSLTPHKIDLDLNFLDQKNYGPKNPPLGRNFGHKFPPSGWSLGRKQNDDIAVQYIKMSMH